MNITTEQKAKAYDEALDKFRPIYELAKQQGRNIDVEEFEGIFPELKESEDERIRKKLLYIVARHNTPKWYGLEVSKVLSWLERQKEQQPAEWSEEDEGNLEECIAFLRSIPREGYTSALVKCENWLKSLSPQSHWKPTEEQMNALLNKLPPVQGMGTRVQRILETLYDDLKKL